MAASRKRNLPHQSPPLLAHSPRQGQTFLCPRLPPKSPGGAKAERRLLLVDFGACYILNIMFLLHTAARCQSGYVEDCKSSHAGSIPARASILQAIHIRVCSLLFSKPAQNSGFSFVCGFLHSWPFVYSRKNWGYVLGVSHNKGGIYEIDQHGLQRSKTKGKAL